MSIPLSTITGNLKRKYCLAAIEKINNEGDTLGREPEDYYIEYRNKLGVNRPYPVKLVVEYAFNMAAQDQNLNLKITSKDFSSSQKLRDFINEKLGFNIKEMKVK